MTIEDLRPGVNWITRRSFKHWSFGYVNARIRLHIWQKRHPLLPSLTAESIGLLEQLLRPTDVGAEWGSGNSTGWFAERTRMLTSCETNPDYYPVVKQNLEARGLHNVTLRLMPFSDHPEEEEMMKSDWVKSARDFADESLDYVLVDSSPRGLLCHAVLPKLRSGGILVLDNANWYLPSPASMRHAPGSVDIALGYPGSLLPDSKAWPKFINATSSWRRLWTSDGISATAIFFKP